MSKRRNKEENNLAFLEPLLAAEWHPTKNGDLKPCDVTCGSGRKVWWRCKYGHEWESTVDNRTNGGNKCPYCSNKKLLSGFNDLATRNPELAAQWHPTKNGNLKASDVFPGASRKVWWRCSKGHEWKADISMRNRYHTKCPYCMNRKVLQGFNDLATTHPELAAQWHPTKNGDLRATDVVAMSNRKVWWKCKEGHEWQAIIFNRTSGNGCPECFKLGRRNKKSGIDQRSI